MAVVSNLEARDPEPTDIPSRPASPLECTRLRSSTHAISACSCSRLRETRQESPQLASASATGEFDPCPPFYASQVTLQSSQQAAVFIRKMTSSGDILTVMNQAKAQITARLRLLAIVSGLLPYSGGLLVIFTRDLLWLGIAGVIICSLAAAGAYAV